MPFRGFFQKNKRGRASDNDRAKGERKAISSIPGDLDVSINRIRQDTGQSPDIVIRTFPPGNDSQTRIAAVYVDGLADKEKVNDFITRSLLLDPKAVPPESNSPRHIVDLVLTRAMTVGEAKIQNDWNGMMFSILSGEIAVMVNGCPEAITGNIRGGQWRAIAEPKAEVNIRGPKDSFNESIATNISLIRRRLKSPNLWLESIKIGDISQTEVAMVYLHGIAEERLVEEARRRLKDIRIDAVLESGYIEELVEDETFTPFPMVYNTERPDVVAGNLLEGRIALLVDGTPNTLILPTTFSQFFKAAEDYYQQFSFAVFMRLIRYVSFFLLLLLPSTYIALTAYHHEMIPTPLAINLLAQREGVPFPVIFEALLMEITFEIMREAGIRMPRAIGQAVSIVGAIVLGQAAVEAGIVTAMMVIIVSFTGIAGFATPGTALSNSARLIRFPLMIAAVTFGFYGVIMGMVLLVAHLVSLRSFGVPYLSPFAPFGFKRQKDTIWRTSYKKLETRPSLDGPVREDFKQPLTEPLPGGTDRE